MQNQIWMKHEYITADFSSFFSQKVRYIRWFVLQFAISFQIVEKVVKIKLVEIFLKYIYSCFLRLHISEKVSVRPFR